MSADASTPDSALVAGVLTGDRSAFAAVYERYATKLYDFAYATTRHREDAADAVADTFVACAERIAQLRDPALLRPWLYAITRNGCLKRLTARNRDAYASEERLEAMPDVSDSPDVATERDENVELVWEAAAGLSDRDRALLDLTVRQGLEGAELGAAIGAETNHAYVLVHRMRSQLERAIGALLLARTGGKDCPELARTLEGWHGTYTPLIRKRIARHIDQCDRCENRKSRLVAPWALLAGVPVFVAPSSLRDRVFMQVWGDGAVSADGEFASDVARAPEGSTPDNSAAMAQNMAPRQTKTLAAHTAIRAPIRGTVAFMIIGGTAVIVALLIFLGIATGGFGILSLSPSASPTTTNVPTRSPAADAKPSPSPSSPSPTAAAPTPSSTPRDGQEAPLNDPAPGVLGVSTQLLELDATSLSGVFEVVNSGGEAINVTVSTNNATVTVSPTELRVEPTARATVTVTSPAGAAGPTTPVVVAAGDASFTIDVVIAAPSAPRVATPSLLSSACISTARQVFISASVESSAPLAAVTLQWSGDASGSASMSGSGGTWAGTIPSAPAPSQLTVFVTATDVTGVSTTSPALAVPLEYCLI